jgi:opacity protein-like surface antigen
VVAIQARYQINKKWEVGPVLEYGAVESLYGLSPTFGLVVNRKIQLKKMEFFVGAIGGYLFWQYKDGHDLSQQTGYNIGLQAGCDIPLGNLVSLYLSAGPRFGKVGTRYGYTQDWTKYEYSTAINFPVMAGIQLHL